MILHHNKNVHIYNFEIKSWRNLLVSWYSNSRTVEQYSKNLDKFNEVN